MELFHYTSLLHIRQILQCRFLDVTHNGLHPMSNGSGPPVVWLTSDAGAHQRWMEGSIVNKGEFRLTVSVPDDEAHHWPAWSKEHGIHPDWYQALADAGGDPETWFVVARRIVNRDWFKLERLTADGFIEVQRRKGALRPRLPTHGHTHQRATV